MSLLSTIQRTSASERGRIAAVTAALVFVAMATFVVRYVSLEAIEIGGDALRVWEFARRLAFGMPLPSELDHHQARFGLVLPTLVLQKLVGTAASDYYAGPLAMGALLHATVFFVGLRLSGALAGSVAVLWLWLFPEMIRPSSQLLPELYGPTYTMLAVAGALAYLDANSRRGRWLALSATGLALFFAYGSKLSYLYFAPGCAAFFLFGRPQESIQPNDASDASRFGRFVSWAARKRLLHAGCLTLLVLLLIGGETALYRLLTEQASQLDVVEKTHRSTKSVVTSASDLFAIYRYAGAAWHQAFIMGAVALVVVVGLARDRRPRLFALLTVVYVLLFTFILRKWNPPTPWAEPHPRYLLAFAPCIAILFGVAVEELVRLPFRWVAEARRARFVRVVTIGAAVGLLLFGSYEPAQRLERGLPTSHAIRRTKRLSKELTSAFEQNIPLVTLTRPPKALTAAASLFIAPEALLARGRLLGTHDIIGKSSKGRRRVHYYLSRELGMHPERHEIFEEAVEARYRSARCYVLMTQRGRFFRVTQRKTSRCSPLLEEPAE